ncbi:MAG: CHAT domain-containing protein, partial [Planctomycetes bacterium]|nr:CHAT domain-containing protein [Planctomycetota bacterium]
GLQLSLAARSEDSDARERAYNSLLHWKGVAARTQSMTLARVHQDSSAEELALLQEIRAQQSLLSKLLTQSADPANDPRLDEARRRRVEAESRLQSMVGARVEAQQVSWPEVHRALQPGEALLDFVVVSPKADPRSPVQLWLTRWDAESPELYDLGPADEIEKEVRAFLRGLGAARGGRTLEAGGVDPARALWKRLWQPVAGRLNDVPRILVSPDGFLGALPLAVLSDKKGRFLLEDHQVMRVADLSGMVHPRSRPQQAAVGLLLVGDVDYQIAAKSPESIAEDAGVERSGRQGMWPPLPASSVEIQALEALYRRSHADAPPPKVLRGAEATEAAVRANAPRAAIVHLSTHGFFESGTDLDLWNMEANASGAYRPTTTTGGQALIQNFPGLASGVVLAGANDPHLPGPDDGLMTAEEWTWLDLSTTRLVVLSACETALGEVQAGEGMLGLPRTLHTAGAESVVSALWEVNDQATADLMQDFHRRIWEEKESPVEALRSAQLRMLMQQRLRGEEPDPVLWGGFVVSTSGSWPL